VVSAPSESSGKEGESAGFDCRRQLEFPSGMRKMLLEGPPVSDRASGVGLVLGLPAGHGPPGAGALARAIRDLVAAIQQQEADLELDPQ
jgi:hypothetical protein